MAGVGDEYDNRRHGVYGVPSSRDNNVVAYSDPGSAWGGQAYDPASQQQQQQQQQQWYGYYPEQQAEERRQGGQDGMAAPPLPAMPPPQAPLPPGLATTAAWAGGDQGAANGGGDAYAGYSNYAQQQGQEYAGYGVGELQLGNGYSNVAAANGAQGSYAQGYAGYNYMGEQNAYGYQGYEGYQKQGENSYGQNAAMYSSGGAQYAAPAQYAQPGTHADAGPYGTSGTYYDPNGYQSAGYRHPGDVDQGQSAWSDPNQGKYSYGGYANAAYGGGDANAKAEGNTQYATQDYSQQWAEYYASLEAAAQAGNGESDGGAQTAAAAAAAAGQAASATYASVVGGSGGQQPAPPGTAAPGGGWAAAAALQQGYGESQGSQMSSSTEAESAGAAWNGGGMEGVYSSQVIFPPLPTQARPGAGQHEQQAVEFEKIQGGHSLLQQQQQQAQSKGAKMHIATNPRIAGNVGGVSAGRETVKPAYVSAGAKKAAYTSAGADAVADATLQPGMFPASLRAYVERALSRCKDESQKAACQGIMKDMITMASKDGTLFTKDWDTEALFAVPPASGVGSAAKKETSQQQSSSGRAEWSPARRAKSRWEAPAAEGSEERAGRSHGAYGSAREGGHEAVKEKNGVHFQSKWERREEGWGKATGATTSIAGSAEAKGVSKRGLKRLRKVGLNLRWGDANPSSESEGEQGQRVVLGSVSTVDTAEEKERRQNRFRRFDRGKEHAGRGGKGSGRGRGAGAGAGAGSASARRATALQLALSSGQGQNGRAVEDIDWDSLTVRGTCQEVEKRYLRLTSAPDPGTVRPLEVLRRALEMVKSTTKSYLFRCEQLKSIRQDLTVQRIRDEFTAEVYETHGRMALEAGDLPEYNQCQTQLKGLYGEGVRGCRNEFAAYSLLYVLFNRGNSRDVASAMARVTGEGRRDAVVQHALEVRHAVAMGNYTAFFRLYRRAPVLSPCLMEMHVEKMRFEAVKCMTRSYRPTIPVAWVARALGFGAEGSWEGEAEEAGEGVEECEEWLRGHGAQVQVDSSSKEWVVEAKGSSTSLFMPEPEDVVGHGDANLALNDFFSRS